MTDINKLAGELYANARAKGFYDHEDRVRNLADNAYARSVDNDYAKNVLAEHFGNRLMLIAGEAVEAHEEVRSGRGVAELYFSDTAENEPNSEWPVASYDQTKLLKPEGVLPELADIAIRTLETMESILKQASEEERAKLRAQVPESEATEFSRYEPVPGGRSVDLHPEDVNVAEVILLKHNYNLSRQAMHGGRKF